MVGIDALTPRDVFQASLQNGLIHDGNLWSDAQKMRNLTSHTYDELLAQKVYEFLLESGQGIFKQLAVDVAQWQTETP
jgi:nucleotidyltransferase substrate binding protein (TIGR01987 family)